MHTLNKQASVPYTTHQMFELVNSIEDYPRFLPWCHQAQILNKTEQEITASLDIAWKGIHKSFTTHNKLYPDQRIEIFLINGPLQHLEGIWTFQDTPGGGCLVTLALEFEFTKNFIGILFQPIFQYIANTLVDAFCKRATELYGHK